MGYERYYYFANPKCLVILNFKCGMSSFYGMEAQDKKHMMLKHLQALPRTNVNNVIMIYRCPVRRFVSFFINWACHPKHRTDSNMHFHRPMKRLLGQAKYQEMMTFIHRNDPVGAVKKLFEFIGPQRNLLSWCNEWARNPHTTPQHLVVTQSPYKPNIFINLNGGPAEIKKLEGLIGHKLPHQNESSKDMTKLVLKACLEDQAIVDCIRRSYASDYRFFEEHGIKL